MRSPLYTAAVLAAALALSGCPYHRRQPLPGPQSSFAAGLLHGAAAHAGPKYGPEGTRVSAIRFFQGSLDEAFSSLPCSLPHAHFRD